MALLSEEEVEALRTAFKCTRCGKRCPFVILVDDQELCAECDDECRMCHGTGETTSCMGSVVTCTHCNGTGKKGR